MASSSGKPVWLDCDPGHDDAIAITLALFASSSSSSGHEVAPLDVLGLSTTHGNASGRHTYLNAVRLLAALSVAPTQCRVWRGADRPLLLTGKADVGIHGDDGLAGVEALPSLQTPADDKAYARMRAHLHHNSSDSSISSSRGPTSPADPDTVIVPPADPLSLIQHQLAILSNRRARSLPPITLIATGPLTNVAMLIRMCPGNDNDEDGDNNDGLTLLRDSISQIVIMGGAAGAPGNRSPLAEWNILVDPEAASIVFDSPIPVVMAGLNVTHQAIFTRALHARLLGIDATHDDALREAHDRSSPVRRMVSSAMTFFAGSYAEEFGFVRGPPIHDMLCVAYVLDPSLFFSLSPRSNAPVATDAVSVASLATAASAERTPCRRFRVQIDTSTGLAAGATVVDFYNQWPVEHDRWSKGGRNAIVLEYVDTERLWPLLFDAVDRAEASLNLRNA